MTNPTWPDVLGTPLQGGFTTTPVDQVLRTDLSGGPQAHRRIGHEWLDMAQVGFQFTDHQFKLFRNFYANATWSRAGDSNDLSGWGTLGTTITDSALYNPKNGKAWRVREDTSTGVHRVLKPLVNVTQNETLIVAISARRDTARSARVGFLDCADGVVSATVNTSTLEVVATTKSPDVVKVEVRDDEFLRITVRGNTGAGVTTPALYAGLTDGANASYLGDGSAFIDFGEAMARDFETGNLLFAPTDGNGKIEGAAGGSAWFRMPLTWGGPVRWLEARFDGPYTASALPGLRWDVRFSAEIRRI